MPQIRKFKHQQPYEGLTWKPDPITHETPLLFVHGATLDYRWWDEHFMAYLAKHGYACHAMSLQGHESDKGWFNWHSPRMRTYADNVAEVAQRLNCPPVVVGHSMGGFVVQKYLERYHAPAAILLASVPSFGFWRVTLRLMKQHMPGIIWDGVRLKRNILRPTPEQLRYICFSPDAPDYFVREYHSRLHWESILALLDMLVLDLPHTKRVHTPMLVLGAANDTTIKAPDVRATARAYGADCAIIPDVPHSMIHEHGWQQVADWMLVWLAQQGI
jgi:hypothetical protein